MRKGDHVGVQRMFRARVGAQAFTVIAMVAGGAYYGQDREKRKELIKLESQQRAEERQAKWLRELEIRDEEDKALKESVKRRQERAEQRKAESAKKTPGTDTHLAALPSRGQVDDQGTQAILDGPGVFSSISNIGGWLGASKTHHPNSDKPNSDKGNNLPKSS